MLRMLLITVTGLTASRAHTEIARRLKEDIRKEQRLGLRRRNAWDDMTDWMSGATDDIADFFSDDMLHWLGDAGETSWDFIYAGLPTAAFQTGWNAMVSVLDDAADYVEVAAETVWLGLEWVNVVWFQCMDGYWTECTDCVEQTCNNDFGIDDEMLKELDATNDIMIMDMNGEWQQYYDGCASAMRSCPSHLDCAELRKLSWETQKLVQETLDKCHYCYHCLPYGSTESNCEKALANVFSADCRGCTASEQGIYNLMYSCSSLTRIHNDIDAIAKAYDPVEHGNSLGTPHVTRSAAEYYDGMCAVCNGCSKFDELEELCSEWETIKDDWDFKAPTIPNVLLPKTYPHY